MNAIEETKTALLQIMKQHPNLTAFGIEQPGDRDARSFQRDRRMLASQARAFELCCHFLDRCELRKTVNVSLGSSYFLKHVVERLANEYVSNGAMIAAVFHKDLPYRVIPHTPNVCIGISSKSWFFNSMDLGRLPTKRWFVS